MLGAGATWLGSPALADDPRDPEADAGAIEEQARKVGLAPFRSVESKHYRVLGDAPELYLKQTLGGCESVATDFFSHYQAQGFEVERPKGKLTAVAFSSLLSFANFLEIRPNPNIGGRYERVSNRLYVYRSGHLNVVFLAHEATHQLAFNVGLLERLGDLPHSISEGIAQYGEMRKADVASSPGRINSMRLTDLAHKQRRGAAWIPLDRLIAEDGPLRGSAGFDTTILAYAQSWLLVYHLMKDPDMLPKFRDYLKAIRPRRDSKHRLDDARQHLGDLDLLDKDLRRLSVRLQKSI
jgi:hypothetical protein